MRVKDEDDHQALLRMRKAIARIRKHLQGQGRENFLSNDLLSDAVLMQLTVVGEEVRRIDPDLLAKYPYPWHLVRAQRNVIAHDYFGIRLPSIWVTVQQDLPPLDELLEHILDTEYQ